LYIMLRLRYFTTICNTNEYIKMGQGTSLGKLYDVDNEIKISKSTCWAYVFIMTLSLNEIMKVCLNLIIKYKTNTKNDL
jgi:hypothetical protein